MRSISRSFSGVKFAQSHSGAVNAHSGQGLKYLNTELLLNWFSSCSAPGQAVILLFEVLGMLYPFDAFLAAFL